MGEDFIEVKALAKSLFKYVNFFKPEFLKMSPKKLIYTAKF